ncbi:Spy/CpxP family protein refolding chaperone [Alteromonas sp. ASW11-36]|uniref:Spy/CpxP family protein refolding chaperone n=1 Tax=Alteromonas arenosi TaxID=3055817 RepID=A0ABT7SZJ1_9ALTE|nr:Spy/CpxP family protein refolding chaperone [Alteromonas sp. ASW11-36]MDM7861607.1 Spy/CpxP family protein refolding chaperone [Alteromonas sp. ASW11-36]
MKKLVLSAIGVALSIQLATATAAPRHEPAMVKALQQLSLSEQQQQQINQIIGARRADVDIFATDGRELRREMKTLVQADVWDQSAIERALLARAELHQSRKLEQAQTRHQVWNVLSAEQQAQMLALIDERGPRNRDRGQLRERLWERISDRLALTDAQYEAISTIRSDFADQRELSKARMTEFRQAEQALIRTSEFDIAAWQDLYTQYQSVKLQQGVAKAYMHHQVLQVLTPEQREKLNQAERKIRQRMHGRGA